ncbi:MAG TPA: hypothetical protein VEJ21_04215 [Acidimicrobiales bacterium]|nr:hypothetical protein [Acidimicrobiales bacterium]
MAWPKLENRGRCQVCDAQIAGNRFFCDDHREADNRPPRAEWAHDPFSQASTEPITSQSDEAGPPPVEDSPASPFEPPPEPTKAKGLLPRLRAFGRGRNGSPPGDAGSGRSIGEKPPQPTKKGRGKRIPLDQDIAELWSAVGQGMERTAHYPTGRMLQYQALGAGVVIDQAVAGSLPDRVLFQPIARGRERWEVVFDVVGPPVMTYVITDRYMRRQAAIEAGDQDALEAIDRQLAGLQHSFEWMVRRMLVTMAPAVRKARERREREAAAIAEAFPDLAPGEDPVAAFVAGIFAPPTFAQPEEKARGEAQSPAA